MNTFAVIGVVGAIIIILFVSDNWDILKEIFRK